MNLRESSFVGSSVLGGVLGFSILGGVLGVLIGVLAAIMIVLSVIFICFLVSGFFLYGIPRFPACEKGCCRGKKDYIHVFTDANNVSDWQCKCGLFYRKRGRYFLKISEKGESPYLRWEMLRFQWIQDDMQ